MVLRTLGVPEETVLADYMLSNKYWDRGDRERPGMDPHTVAMIFSAREDYFRAAFDAVSARYPSLQEYLQREVGLTANEHAQLHQIYLE